MPSLPGMAAAQTRAPEEGSNPKSELAQELVQPSDGLRRIILVMAALMVSVEFVIMQLFAWVSLDWPDWQLSLLDALMLAVVVGSVTYWGLIRPRDRRLQAMLEALNTARVAAEEQARVDALTSVLSRRAIFTLLDAEWARARRHANKLSCLMVDIDEFKKLNDNYGHQVGDEVLRKVAAAIKEQCRSIDQVGRYGGEEFLVVSPESNLAGGMVLAERIREAVSQLSLEHQGAKFQTTVSIGVAERADDMESSATLVAGADIALYRAKENGRNCALAFEREQSAIDP